MAGFKTHTTYGAFTGAIISAVSYVNNWTTDYIILVIIFSSSVIGSFLPDIDSDTGKPVRIVFGLLSIIGSLLSIILVLYNYPERIEYLILIPILTFITIRYVVSYIFKKFTHHRGIYHSIPAMLIFFMLTALVVSEFQLDLSEKILISTSVAMGFLSHLILDELYANTSFLGIPYKPNKAFGSALEFFSKSKISTTVAYLLLISLIYLNMNFLNDALTLILK